MQSDEEEERVRAAMAGVDAMDARVRRQKSVRRVRAGEGRGHREDVEEEKDSKEMHGAN